MAGVRTDAGRNHAAIGRLSVDKFSRVVSQEEIRANEYNLNIPRYLRLHVRRHAADIKKIPLPWRWL